MDSPVSMQRQAGAALIALVALAIIAYFLILPMLFPPHYALSEAVVGPVSVYPPESVAGTVFTAQAQIGIAGDHHLR